MVFSLFCTFSLSIYKCYCCYGISGILWVQLDYLTVRRKNYPPLKKNSPETQSEVRNQALLFLNTSHKVQTSPSGRRPVVFAVLLGTVQEKTINLAVHEHWVYSNTAGQRATVQEGNNLQAHDETCDSIEKQEKQTTI